MPSLGTASYPVQHFSYGPYPLFSFWEHMTDRDLGNHENNKDSYEYF